MSVEEFYLVAILFSIGILTFMYSLQIFMIYVIIALIIYIIYLLFEEKLGFKKREEVKKLYNVNGDIRLPREFQENSIDLKNEIIQIIRKLTRELRELIQELWFENKIERMKKKKEKIWNSRTQKYEHIEFIDLCGLKEEEKYWWYDRIHKKYDFSSLYMKSYYPYVVCKPGYYDRLGKVQILINGKTEYVTDLDSLKRWDKKRKKKN